MESGRMTADYNVSAYDLSNTFLPGFKEATSKGGALGFMCSYSSINGVPSCGNPWLETELWRNQWGGGNGSVGGSYIVSDCGAVKHFVDKKFNASAEEAVAQVSLSLCLCLSLSVSFCYEYMYMLRRR